MSRSGLALLSLMLFAGLWLLAAAFAPGAEDQRAYFLAGMMHVVGVFVVVAGGER